MNERKQIGCGSWARLRLLLLLAAPAWLAAQPTPEANAAFNSYIGRVEARLDAQHRSASGFLAPVDFARLRQGELIIAQLTTGAGTELPGALLHDWRGTAFIPGGKAADFERVMKNFDAYPKVVFAASADGESDRTRWRSFSGHDAGAAEARADGGDGYGIRHHLWRRSWIARSMDTAFRAARRLRRSTRRERRTSARWGRAKSTVFCGG